MKRIILGIALIAGSLVVGVIVVALVLRPLRREDWLETEGRITEVKYALEDYRADHGHYPTDEDGLSVLLTPPPETREGPRYFLKQYVLSEQSLSDTWGNPITYQKVRTGSEEGCVISSLGRDGKEGGTGPDEDIRMVCHPSL